MKQASGRATCTLRVGGLANYTDNLKKLASINPDWKLSPEEILSSDKADQKIFKLKFITRPVSLQPDEIDGSLISVFVGGYQIGIIRAEDAEKVRSILDQYDVTNISCGIWGGQYKVIDENCNVEVLKQGISATIRIAYEELTFAAEDELIFDEPSPAGKAAPKKKKEKSKKPFYKRWWFWVIVIFFLMGNYGSNDETDVSVPVETTATTDVVETTTAPVETEAPIVTETTPEENTVSWVTIDTAINLIEPILEENFQNHKITYENNILSINVWNEGIAIGTTLAASGDQECIDAWNNVVSKQKDMCNSLHDLVSTMGLTDVSVVVNVLNDMNTDNVLLTVFDGVVFYNCIND